MHSTHEAQHRFIIDPRETAVRFTLHTPHHRGSRARLPIMKKAERHPVVLGWFDPRFVRKMATTLLHLLAAGSLAYQKGRPKTPSTLRYSYEYQTRCWAVGNMILVRTYPGMIARGTKKKIKPFLLQKSKERKASTTDMTEKHRQSTKSQRWSPTARTHHYERQVHQLPQPELALDLPLHVTEGGEAAGARCRDHRSKRAVARYQSDRQRLRSSRRTLLPLLLGRVGSSPSCCHKHHRPIITGRGGARGSSSGLRSERRSTGSFRR